ncbi:NAD(P)-dependent malic enzyme [Nocardioides sp. B-3]|uniref:NAD(P)-dependent malic enzyme n=1 Tax=Nocardioides sp. B-3 TaxID=2895565 RepID=UPI003FA558BA
MTQHYTWVPNVVAIVSDGTAVLGLGDIGPAAAMPVMEGKAVLFKQFGGVDAVPICLNTTDVEEIIETVQRLAPSFGGINLEDISAPRCFEIEDRLKASLDIPVFHDDQHGTAVVAPAALTNALRLTGRTPEGTRVVISGAGAAGVAVARILLRGGRPRHRRHRPPGRAQLHPLRPHARQGRAREGHGRQLRPQRLPRPTRWPVPTSTSASPVAPCPRRSWRRWRPTRSSSARPTRHPRCTPTSRTSTPASSRPVAPTSPTRSTTCWPSRGSSAVPSTCTPRRSPRT